MQNQRRQTSPARLPRKASAVILALGMLASACTGGPAEETTAPPSVLRVVQSVAVKSFDQNVDFGLYARRVTESVHEKLATFAYSSGQYELVPQLATRWEMIEPRRWRFTLREGVKFTNGQAFTDKDVVDSFDSLIGDPKSVYQPFLGSYKMERVDDLHVDILTKTPNLALVPIHVSMLQILPSDTIAKIGRPGEGDKPVGTGPYMVTKFEKGVQVDLKANPHYWGDLPSIDKISVRFITEGATRVSELSSGGADIVDSVAPVLESRVTALPDAELRKSPTMSKYFLAFNTVSAPGSDLALRRAINYAIDRREIIALFGGNATPLMGAFAPGEQGYDKSYTSFEYDPDRAKQILADAGLTNPRITLGHSINELPEDSDIAEVVQAQLERVGITVKLDGGPWSVKSQRFMQGEQPGMFLIQSGAVYPSPDFTFRVHMGRDTTYGKAYGSPKVDELMAKASTTADAAERTKIFQAMQHIGIDESVFWAPLVVHEDVWGVNKNLSWTPEPMQMYGFARMSLKS